MKEEFHFYDVPLEKTYVRLKETYRLSLFKRIRTNLNEQKLLKLLSCSKSGLYMWEKGKRAIPSTILFKISKLIKNDECNLKDIERNITHIYSGKRSNKQGSIGKSLKNIIFPLKISPKLSRLIANILGDGSININHYFNTTYFNKEKKLIDKIKKDSLKIFGEFKYNINKGKNNIYYINLPSIMGMILYYWFGDFSSKKAKVPEQILNSKSKLIKCNFLQGIFDDEGTIDKKSKTLKVFSTSVLLIKGIHRLLKDIGIKPTRVYSTKYVTKVNHLKRTYFTVSIKNRRGIHLFRDNVSFIHPRKQYFLEKMVE